jgi:Domain of unknown function (DUF6265)
MTKAIRSVVLLGALFFCTTANSETLLVSKLHWLTGCWVSENGETGSGEQWTSPAGGTIFGVGRTIKRGKTVEHEFLQVREQSDGDLVLTAAPSGQAIATFKAIKLTSNEVVFENLQHDFPQRVAYRLASAGRLVGRIEGMRKDKLTTIEFPLRKTSCDISDTSK